MTTTLPTRTFQGLARPFFSDPFRSLNEEMNDLLGRFSIDWAGGSPIRERIPSLDLTETDGTIEIKMDLPGIKSDEVDIEVDADSIRISGEHKEEQEETGKTFHRIERRAGSFSRLVTLPCAIDQEHVVAESRDGVLTITLPKSEESKTRKVPVKG